MKKLIRLTEQDLHNIVKETVHKFLNESVIYGNMEPFETILKAASEIRKNYEYAASEDYEPWDDSDGRDLAPEVYEWAKRVEDEAEDWLRYSSASAPINGGENW